MPVSLCLCAFHYVEACVFLTKLENCRVYKKYFWKSLLPNCDLLIGTLLNKTGTKNISSLKLEKLNKSKHCIFVKIDKFVYGKSCLQ